MLHSSSTKFRLDYMMAAAECDLARDPAFPSMRDPTLDGLCAEYNFQPSIVRPHSNGLRLRAGSSEEDGDEIILPYAQASILVSPVSPTEMLL